MALTLEAGNLVWTKVSKALINANPAVQGQFKALREYIVSQRANPTLQFVSFSDADITTATGYTFQAAAGALTLYGFYFIKNGTSGTGTATDAWISLDNASTNTVVATKFISIPALVAADQFALTYPGGLPFSVDFTVTGETSAKDGTEVSAGDAGSGFAIVGA